MAGETFSPQPSLGGSYAATTPYLDAEQKGQVYPDPAVTITVDTLRPTYGQCWPRGNVRGNT